MKASTEKRFDTAILAMGLAMIPLLVAGARRGIPAGQLLPVGALASVAVAHSLHRLLRRSKTKALPNEKKNQIP